MLDSYYLLLENLPIRRAYYTALQIIPTLSSFVKSFSYCKNIFSSTLPPTFTSKYGSIFCKPKLSFFKPLNLDSLSKQEIMARFLEFVDSNFNNVISFYTDGSKLSSTEQVGAGVFSPDLSIKLIFKLPSSASIFSAEAWALLQALLIIKDFKFNQAVIFTDSQAVLDDIAFTKLNSKKITLL